jgi:putative ABC transport system permease protein
MAPLDRKLLRDLWHLRGQAIAVAIVVASGAAVLVMSLSALEALRETTAAYYERYRFADVFASAVRAPRRIAEQVAEVPGVQAVDARIARFASLDIDGFAEPAIGRLTSIPENSQPTLNQLALRSGRWLTPNRPDEVILSEPFAEAHALVPGDSLRAVVNGRRRTLTVVGTALSPEFVFALAPGALMPDDRRFGVLWMGREALEAAYDLDGAFDDLSVALLRGADREHVMSEVDRLLAPYGGVSALPRAEQLSNFFVTNELDQLATMATILPTIFLGVASFLVYTVLARLIAVERSEIGLLKAFGYTNTEVGWHYTKLALAIAALGIVVGFVLGAYLGLFNTRQYAEFYRFPLLIYRPSASSFSVAALVSLAATVVGALAAVRNATALPPAVAMRPPSPAVYRRTRLTASGLGRWLDQPTRIALRQIVRFPLRSALTTVGIALSVGLMVMTMQWRDSIDWIARVYFYDAQHQSIMVGLADERAMTVLEEAKRLPGVLAAEPVRFIAAEFVAGTRRHRGAITGVPSDATLQPIHDDATGKVVAVPPAGLVLGTYLAEKLGVGAGDRVWVDVLEGRRPSGFVTVAATVEQTISTPAYMDLDALNRWLRIRPSVDYINLLVNRDAEPALFAELKELPAISAIMVKQAAIDSFYETIGEQMMIFISLFSAFAAALGIGVAYNSARIALSERSRELATLRVLGFTRGEISYVLLAELALLAIVALPLGCVVGRALAWLIALAFETELFRMPMVVEASTYGLASVFAIAATVASGALVRRRIDNLDLIAVLKTRE